MTNAFSKKLDNLKAACALYFAYYNFCRVHQTLRVTPAMEAGISDHVWNLEELVGKLLICLGLVRGFPFYNQALDNILLSEYHRASFASKIRLASMALRVPEQQVANIKKLLELPDDKIAGFLDALVKAEPTFNVYNLSAQASGKSELPYPLALGIVQVLASLYVTRERDWKQPIEQFVDGEVFAALQRAQTFSAEDVDVQWKRLRGFLVTALSLERAIGTAVKAGPVLTAHERIFSGAKIMTDLRPIFHLNVSEKPDAAMIVHMLKITQRDDHNKKTDKYFALDSNDLAAMKELIERAMKKEETLRAIMKDSGVTILAPGFIY